MTLTLDLDLEALKMYLCAIIKFLGQVIQKPEQEMQSCRHAFALVTLT